MTTIKAEGYPLAWPAGWKRTSPRRHGHFGKRRASMPGGYAMFQDITIAALPAPGQTVARSWREILGFRADDPLTLDVVEARYKARRSSAHPDKGGTAEEFAAIATAWAQAQETLR